MSERKKDYPSIGEIVEKIYYGNKRRAFIGFLSDPQAFIIPELRKGFGINKNSDEDTQLGGDSEKETGDK